MGLMGPIGLMGLMSGAASVSLALWLGGFGWLSDFLVGFGRIWLDLVGGWGLLVDVDVGLGGRGTEVEASGCSAGVWLGGGAEGFGASTDGDGVCPGGCPVGFDASLEGGGV